VRSVTKSLSPEGRRRSQLSVIEGHMVKIHEVRVKELWDKQVHRSLKLLKPEESKNRRESGLSDPEGTWQKIMKSR
jgi:hypothetical protein